MDFSKRNLNFGARGLSEAAPNPVLEDLRQRRRGNQGRVPSQANQWLGHPPPPQYNPHASPTDNGLETVKKQAEVQAEDIKKLVEIVSSLCDAEQPIGWLVEQVELLRKQVEVLKQQVGQQVELQQAQPPVSDPFTFPPHQTA